MSDAIDKSKEAIAKVLVDQNVLSQAQVDLAYMDMEVQDLPFDEVLYMRGWITQEKLYELAPFLKPGYVEPAQEAAPKENLQKKIKDRSKPGADEVPLVIALGSPQEEATEAPVIALGAPQEEATEAPVIALGAPQEEATEAPVIALGAPQDEAAAAPVIALGAPQDEAAAAPVIALGAPQDEAAAAPVIALGAPQDEAAAAPVIALAAPQAATQPAQETPPIALAAQSGEGEARAEGAATNSTKSAELQHKTLAATQQEDVVADAALLLENKRSDKKPESLVDEDPLSNPVLAGVRDPGALFEKNDQSVDDLFNTIKSPATRIEEPPTERLSKQERKIAEMEESIPAMAKDELKPKSQDKTDTQSSTPRGISSTSSPRTDDDPEKSSDTAGSSTTKAKPADIPGEPPLRSAEKPAVIQSPVEKSKEQSLKAYKEVLRKILTVEKK